MKRIMTKTNRTRFTRMCITDAIISLLQEVDYDKLRVSAIVERAGIARMTFYNYYDSPRTALTDYLSIISDDFARKSSKDYAYLSYEHILFSLNFFDQFREYFLTLSRQGLHSIMQDAVNRFMLENIGTEDFLSDYALYAYAGGLLNVFLKWEEDGKSISAEEVADSIYKLYCGALR